MDGVSSTIPSVDSDSFSEGFIPRNEGPKGESGPRDGAGSWVNSIGESRGPSLDQKEFVAAWQAKPPLSLQDHEPIGQSNWGRRFRQTLSAHLRDESKLKETEATRRRTVGRLSLETRSLSGFVKIDFAPQR